MQIHVNNREVWLERIRCAEDSVAQAIRVAVTHYDSLIEEAESEGLFRALARTFKLEPGAEDLKFKKRIALEPFRRQRRQLQAMYLTVLRAPAEDLIILSQRDLDNLEDHAYTTLEQEEEQ